jgi:hypothetical protein
MAVVVTAPPAPEPVTWVIPSQLVPVQAGAVQVTSADSGHAAEAGNNGLQFAKSSADSARSREAAYGFGGDWARAAEAASVHATLSKADTGHGTEAGSAAPASGTSPHSADTVLAVESAFYARSGSDSPHGTEAAHMAVSGHDAVSGADRPLNSWPDGADAGKAAGRPHSAGLNPGADTARAAESVKPFPFSSADAASAADAVHEIGIWTYLPVNVRLLVPYRHDPVRAARLEEAVRRLEAAGGWARVERRVRSAEVSRAAEKADSRPGLYAEPGTRYLKMFFLPG